MRTNIFVIGVEVGVVESYGGGKRVTFDWFTFFFY